MTGINEKTYIGDIVRTEMPNGMSRKRVTIASSAALLAGTVLGQITMGTASIEAFAGNTGSSGTIASAAVADGAKPGAYKVIIIEPGSNAGVFTVEDPDGILVGTGTVAVEFVGGGLTFTVTDATDFVAGDGFTITVAAGSGKYKKAPATAVDGSDAGAAILLEDADASDGDVTDVLVLYRDAQVDITRLIYDDTVDDADKQAAVRAGLLANNIQFLSAA